MSRAATAIALVSALVLPLKGCGAIEEPYAVVPGPRGAAAGTPYSRLAMRWASTDFAVGTDGSGVVELEVVLENSGPGGTESTSILWEPAFARSYTFAGSEPASWRARVDQRGWGVLDTSGVLPGRSGTFRLWFTARVPSDQVTREAIAPRPRIVVVADGRRVVADTVADVRLAVPPAGRWHRVFERGPLATVADGVAFVPASARRAFPFAVGLAMVLGVLAGAGAVAGFRTTVWR